MYLPKLQNLELVHRIILFPVNSDRAVNRVERCLEQTTKYAKMLISEEVGVFFGAVTWGETTYTVKSRKNFKIIF